MAPIRRKRAKVPEEDHREEANDEEASAAEEVGEEERLANLRQRAREFFSPPQFLDKNGQPKRSPNAFMVYAGIHRKHYKNMKTADVSRMLSPIWNTLDPTTRAIFTNRARELKDEHNMMFPDYVWRRSRNGEGKEGKGKRGKEKGGDGNGKGEEAEVPPPFQYPDEVEEQQNMRNVNMHQQFVMPSGSGDPAFNQITGINYSDAKGFLPPYSHQPEGSYETFYQQYMGINPHPTFPSPFHPSYGEQYWTPNDTIEHERYHIDTGMPPPLLPQMADNPWRFLNVRHETENAIQPDNRETDATPPLFHQGANDFVGFLNELYRDEAVSPLFPREEDNSCSFLNGSYETGGPYENIDMSLVGSSSSQPEGQVDESADIEEDDSVANMFRKLRDGKGID